MECDTTYEVCLFGLFYFISDGEFGGVLSGILSSRETFTSSMDIFDFG